MGMELKDEMLTKAKLCLQAQLNIIKDSNKNNMNVILEGKHDDRIENDIHNEVMQDENTTEDNNVEK